MENHSSLKFSVYRIIITLYHSFLVHICVSSFVISLSCFTHLLSSLAVPLFTYIRRPGHWFLLASDFRTSRKLWFYASHNISVLDYLHPMNV